jgi:hypothetical protein
VAIIAQERRWADVERWFDEELAKAGFTVGDALEAIVNDAASVRITVARAVA